MTDEDDVDDDRTRSNGCYDDGDVCDGVGSRGDVAKSKIEG